MMPWEHVLFGYIGYSLLVRGLRQDSPTTGETIVVILASGGPDLIDKPLAWQFDLFASGYALGHSMFTATVLSLLAFAITRQRGQPRTGLAFTIAYGIHLLADIVPTSPAEPVAFHRILWPVIRGGDGYGTSFAFEARENLTGYFGWIAEQLTSGTPDPYFIALLGAAGLALLLWVDDGLPVGADLYAGVTGLASR
jgi:hypothetical protein